MPRQKYRLNCPSTLKAISPLDGRYWSKVAVLSSYFSEQALIKNRLEIELKYFLFLAKKRIIPYWGSSKERKLLQIWENFNDKEAQKVKEIEKEINHDTKAVEYYLRRKTKPLNLPVEFLHFALTTYDIDANAYSLALKRCLAEVILPQLRTLILKIKTMAFLYKKSPLLGRTHGQPAVPTTMGKELIVFALRLNEEYINLENLPFKGKLNGAVGNYNAHQVGFPQTDWIRFSSDFIFSLGLEPEIFSTQILPYDSFIRIFQSMFLINQILIGLTQDLWDYISRDYFLQKIVKKEVGSSTMPQKVNPIDLENSEGNLGIANGLWGFFSQKLAISRLQRDLSDKTVKRNIGMAFAYSLLGYQGIVSGLEKLVFNEKLARAELEDHWEIIAEGLQTILRSSGDQSAYEKLKDFSRGKKLNREKIEIFIERLKIKPGVKKKLLTLTPINYLGLAPELVEAGLKVINL